MAAYYEFTDFLKLFWLHFHVCYPACLTAGSRAGIAPNRTNLYY